MKDLELLTAMNNSLFVDVGNSLKNFTHHLGGILLGELSVFANPIKKFPTDGQLRDDVVFVLANSC